MTRRVRTMARRAWTELRPIAWIGMAAVAYALLRLLFTRSVERAGLFSPSGLGDPVVLLLGLVVIALRLVLLFVAPGVVAYYLVSRRIAPNARLASPTKRWQGRPP